MKNPTGNTALYLLQIVISGILMLVLIPVISQHLTPNDFGQFVLAQVYASVAVGIANLGVLLGYERNFFIFEKSNKDSAKLISSAMVFVTFNLVILLVAVYIFQLEISSLILSDNTPNDYNTETTMKQMHQQIQLITNH
jgi:O-antigen/teichoic acid export membrane protein